MWYRQPEKVRETFAPNHIHTTPADEAGDSVFRASGRVGVVQPTPRKMAHGLTSSRRSASGFLIPPVLGFPPLVAAHGPKGPGLSPTKALTYGPSGWLDAILPVRDLGTGSTRYA